MDDLEEKLIAEGFVRTHYGWIKVISPSGIELIELIIAPGKDTRREGSTEMNPHPGEIWQTIEHLGYEKLPAVFHSLNSPCKANSSYAEPAESQPRESLLYKFIAPDGRVEECYFGKGDVFDSVSTTAIGVLGFFHYNMNVGSAPIKLRVRREKE